MCRRALDSGARWSGSGRSSSGRVAIRECSTTTAVCRRRPRNTSCEPADGFVTDLDAGLIGRAVVALGGGRDKEVDDEIDPAVGVMIVRRSAMLCAEATPCCAQYDPGRGWRSLAAI